MNYFALEAIGIVIVFIKFGILTLLIDKVDSPKRIMDVFKL